MKRPVRWFAARQMESIMAQPTFEVHGIVGGYSGPGIKTIVPHRAEAKLSTRLVPDQATTTPP